MEDLHAATATTFVREALADPIVRAVMARDGLTERDVVASCLTAREQIARHARTESPASVARASHSSAAIPASVRWTL